MMLSIIIPVYNEQENLIKRLSFLCEKANKNNIEIIIANSPESIDESQLVCNKYAKVIHLDCKIKGRAAQMNAGAKLAKGDVLMFLHADVVLPEDFYLQVKTAVNKGNKFGFFAYKFDVSTTLLNLNSKFTKKDGLFAGGGDQCQFFTKETFKALKGYNENFCIMEDFEMMDRIRKHKIPFKIIQSKATVSARKYNNNSWLKVNLINGYVFLKYRLGVHPTKLRKTYKSLLRESV
ncbi:TIGR04283 family arsenosugar biosynthesis glycosyltransferase [Polaribacter vadi]|uniref:TIGR04283 family arsenosugar biosynthesis glycosyltransferase n=1 Tax=Polaribacter TaxID=52959 RepID=UPI001C0990AA|nr:MULTISPECIES: TIGR04283 family arsenosugar biosynthesis glycosyltransferase [Polaribacter]MBU3011431.1 TIGR04283 family arsenosugar biosynthesis glycosyltransferase [Polaribacter vadi]MDO6741243.1 TIGR04283 family arsenosugar biosynthesis glycosyltransferase [Polaribacter sp. 1_MG-2023]